MYLSCRQSKEVERLNGVYNKLLMGAGVEMIGRYNKPASRAYQLLQTVDTHVSMHVWAAQGEAAIFSMHCCKPAT